MNFQFSLRPARSRLQPAALVLACLLLCAPAAWTQAPGPLDIARQSIVQIPDGMTSKTVAIYGVTLGMPWGDARNVLDRSNVPYIFQKGTSPIVYIPPQNSTYYFILNPSSYAIIEMGIIGTSDLPLDNQYLFDAQRWRLTTARTQFFGNEGEFIVNEEGEAYNFPYLGFVLKYLTPQSFRFVMVEPTNQPLTAYGRQLKPGSTPTQPVKAPTAAAPPPPPPQQTSDLEAWLMKFQAARNDFEGRRYSTALTSFRDISQNAPDALLRVRALYWTGEAHYGMKQFREARQQFERVLQETDIESLRTPAQLMISRCNAK